MKIIALGTSNFLISCVNGLKESGHEIVCLISKPADLLPVNSINIEGVARELGVDYFETEDINSDETAAFLKNMQPDLIFSAWPKIIKQHILDIPKYGIVGSHPTSLPSNRGRHPLHWQIVLKIKQSMMSFFLMDEGVDSGNILLQVPYETFSDDDIKNIAERLDAAAFDSAKKLGEVLNKESFLSEAKVQDHGLANTWRKRTLFDVTIDFRMPADDIIALVRSFSHPFSYAIVLNEHGSLRVTNARIVTDYEGSIAVENMEHGRIVSIDKNKLKIKATDGIIELTCLDDIKHSGKYFHPPMKYLIDNPSLKEIFI